MKSTEKLSKIGMRKEELFSTQFPKRFVTTDVNPAIGQRSSSENRLSEFHLTDNLALFTGDVDTLADSGFTEDIEIAIVRRNRAATEGTFQACSPEPFTRFDIRTVQHAGVVDDKNFLSDDERAGSSGTLGGLAP